MTVQHVPARDVPIPTTVSTEAQAMLELTATLPSVERAPMPAPGDFDGWRQHREAAETATMTMAGAAPLDVEVEDRMVDGVGVFVVTPAGVSEDDPHVILSLHGGGFTHGGGAMCRWLGSLSAVSNGARSWAVDYRLPPEHPYPAPLDDCLTAYRALLADHRPEEVIVEGASAGGNLVAATILRARDEGLPLPAAAIMISPEMDLTEAGDTFATNLGVDTVLTGSLMEANLVYAGGRDLRDPYLSPLYADLTRGFPPSVLTTGTRDLFLSNTVRMHRALRAAGVRAELHVWEAAGHAMFLGGTPEDADRATEVRSFVDEIWGRR
jgi:acetyl esterase/lipase